MLRRLNAASLFVFITYFFLSCVPFAPLIFGRTTEPLSITFALEFACWLLVWAVFGKPSWFQWLLLPAFLLLPVELYLNRHFGQTIAPHHLGIIAETSPREAWEFLGNKAWMLLLVGGGMLTWWGATWGAARHAAQLHWRGASRFVALLLLAAIAGTYWYKPNLVPAQVDASHLKDQLKKTWPFGWILRGAEFWQERQYLGELAHKNAQFRFGVQPHSPAAQTIVVTIGESSRYDRWGINGYTRDTTPYLRQETNLVSFTNMITAVSATRLSVPVIMSRKPATQSLVAGFSEKSFLSAFKEAGFKTFWLSNQMSFGQFDTPVSVFAQEADVTQFLNLGGFTNHSDLDSVLLNPLQQALHDAAPKKLIVLHTLGNHWNYSHRHPPQFNQWQPSLSGVENPVYTDLKIKQQLNNSYDNSMLYVDWFLAQVIGQLKTSPAVSALFYVADHGQTLYDGSCNLAFHGHNSAYEFHVPAFIWYSNAYAQHYPDKIQQLHAHQTAKLTTENVFHTVVDMADIHYPSEQPERSIVNARLRYHTRYVDSYGWTHYDNATLKGDCKEVIDRSKPLPQK